MLIDRYKSYKDKYPKKLIAISADAKGPLSLFDDLPRFSDASSENKNVLRVLNWHVQLLA